MGDAEGPDDGSYISPYEIRLEERKKWAKRTRRSFLALGVVGGVVGCGVAFVVTSSWALAVFTLGIVVYVVGRGVGQVVTVEAKVERALYFAVAPLTALASLSAVYLVWGRWWSAALLGTAGGLAGHGISKRLFRRVAWQVELERLELGRLLDW